MRMSDIKYLYEMHRYYSYAYTSVKWQPKFMQNERECKAFHKFPENLFMILRPNYKKNLFNGSFHAK